MVSKTRMGVGLISVGWMGKVHTRAYQSLPIFYPELGVMPELVVAADPVEERQRYARDVLGFSEAVGDYREVLSRDDVDVVSICAPNFLHAEIGIAAAQAGKSFWIEKPVGRNAVDTEAVESAAVSAGVTTSIGFNYRHAPALEYARQIIAVGELGEITNFRGTFFADYSSDPRGALSWRFFRDKAGSGVSGDLMGHLVDLIHYILGPIDRVSAATSIVHAQRPVLAAGGGTHFDLIEGGELGDVENEDYVAMLVQLRRDAVAASALGTLEASRITVGKRAAYNLEIYGTRGSLAWDFERMNELELALDNDPARMGFQRIMAGPAFGDFSHFQPGAGTSMGFDDLKIVEAKKFVQSFLGRDHLNSNIHDAVAAARVVDAGLQSAADERWHHVAPVEGTTAAFRSA